MLCIANFLFALLQNVFCVLTFRMKKKRQHQAIIQLFEDIFVGTDDIESVITNNVTFFFSKSHFSTIAFTEEKMPREQ